MAEQSESSRFIDRWTIECVRFYAHLIERAWRALGVRHTVFLFECSSWERSVGPVTRFELNVRRAPERDVPAITQARMRRLHDLADAARALILASLKRRAE